MRASICRPSLAGIGIGEKNNERSVAAYRERGAPAPALTESQSELRPLRRRKGRESNRQGIFNFARMRSSITSALGGSVRRRVSATY